MILEFSKRGGEHTSVENITLISDLVSNNLFPIAMCLILMWYIKGVQEKERDAMAEMSKVISENTIVMKDLQQIVKEHLCNK